MEKLKPVTCEGKAALKGIAWHNVLLGKAMIFIFLLVSFLSLDLYKLYNSLYIRKVTNFVWEASAKIRIDHLTKGYLNG